MLTLTIMRPKSLSLVPRRLCFAAVGGILLLSLSQAKAQTELAAMGTPAELKKLSLEQLMDLEITSVSKKVEKVSQAAAAVHVVTQEDIRRSGARSIPEALKLAPNLQVAQTSSQSWAITARGFNG